MSRIYGGIHFSFANEDGRELGEDVAEWVLESFAQSSSGDAALTGIAFARRFVGLTGGTVTRLRGLIMYADKRKAEYWGAYADWLRQMARHTNEDDRFDTQANSEGGDGSIRLTRRNLANLLVVPPRTSFAVAARSCGRTGSW